MKNLICAIIIGVGCFCGIATNNSIADYRDDTNSFKTLTVQTLNLVNKDGKKLGVIATCNDTVGLWFGDSLNNHATIYCNDKDGPVIGLRTKKNKDAYVDICLTDYGMQIRDGKDVTQFSFETLIKSFKNNTVIIQQNINRSVFPQVCPNGQCPNQ